MKRVIFGFSRPLKWKPYAQAIMLADGSKISHGYSRFESDRWACSFVYQSSGHKTNFMGGTHFDSINERVEEYALEVPDDVEAKIGNLCVSREGKPYAVKQVCGKAVVVALFILSFGKLRVQNPFKDGDKTTDCIEEMAAILSTGLGIQVPLDMDNVTVKPFRDWIATLPGVQKIKGEAA